MTRIENQSIFFVLLLIILTACPGGSHFPYPSSFGEGFLRAIYYFYTIVFSLILFWTIGIIKIPKLLSNTIKSLKLNQIISPLSVFVFFTFIILGLHIFQAKYFFNLGYQIPSKPFLSAYIMTFGLIIFFYIYKNNLRKHLVLVSLIWSILLRLIPIIFFPISPERSDMLPSITASIDGFFAGGNPYTPYLGVTQPMAYLPLTWISFIPANLLNFDLRIMSVIYDLITYSIIYKIWNNSDKTNPDKESLSIVIIGWYLFPYYHFRHDLYFSIYFLLLVLTFFYLNKSINSNSKKDIKSNSIIAALFLGFSIATRQWSWVLWPFFSLFCYFRWKVFGIYLSIFALISGLLIVVPFMVVDFDLFYHSVISIYDQIESMKQLREYTVGFSNIFNETGLLHLLGPIQYIILLGFGITAVLYLRSLQSLFQFSIACLFVFILFNKIVSTYLYISLIQLVIVFLILKTNRVSSA